MSFSERLKDALWNLKKSRSAKVTLLVVLLVAVITAAGYVLFGGGGTSSGTDTSNTNTASVVSEQLLRRAIDGIRVPPSRANDYPVAVVVENLVAARPQAGLDKANLVYEALAEGGITRFLAVFASGDDVKKIGPVRSARTNHLDWVRELGAMFVHAGGSPAALAGISASQINDFNQFFNGQYFDRDQERRKTHALEHTLYTTSTLLARAVRDTSSPEKGAFDPWLFTDDAPLADRPTDPKSITIDFSSFNYKVTYEYQREENVYERQQAEQPHRMEDRAVITAKNVVVQYVKTTRADEIGRLEMDLVGDGDAIVFQNGKAIVSTWRKSAVDRRTRYFDERGDEIIFVAGTTWVEIVPTDREVEHT